MYCRLSRDDEQDGISGSIKNQQAILEKYAKDNGFKNTRVFVDDGWSDTNFARPAFTEIMELANQGKIGTLIVKDHSRLGRNRLIVGQLLEEGFDESKFKAVQGNLSDKVSGKYSVVVANIVADIIMEFNKEVGKYLENDGVYITGGIIESREDEVLLSFAQNGFEVKERFEEKGWLVFVVKKSK